jgi:hypothetical protein
MRDDLGELEGKTIDALDAAYVYVLLGGTGVV